MLSNSTACVQVLVGASLYALCNVGQEALLGVNTFRSSVL